jgi:hypothetical protein
VTARSTRTSSSRSSTRLTPTTNELLGTHSSEAIAFRSRQLLTDVIVQPLEYCTDAKVDEYLAATGAQVVAVDRAVAQRAAQLRTPRGACLGRDNDDPLFLQLKDGSAP